MEESRTEIRDLPEAVQHTRNVVEQTRFWEKFGKWALWGWLLAGTVAVAGKLTSPLVVWTAFGLAVAVAATLWLLLGGLQLPPNGAVENTTWKGWQ